MWVGRSKGIFDVRQPSGALARRALGTEKWRISILRLSVTKAVMIDQPF